MHRRNNAKRAIPTFKAHFISILASVDPSFPRHRWDLLLPQAELTVNLLRQSLLQPNISAWEHFTAHSTLMQHPWAHQDAGSLHMQRGLHGNRGTTVATAVSMSDQHRTTTDASRSSRNQHPQSSYRIWSSSNTQPCQCLH